MRLARDTQKVKRKAEILVDPECSRGGLASVRI